MKTENELIAEFMGFVDGGSYWATTGESPYVVIDGTTTYHRLYPSQLQFDTSWDWLMPVVEKIERFGNRCEIGITKCKIYSADYTREPFYAATKIQAVYDHVVDFIKWYNENKQP